MEISVIASGSNGNCCVVEEKGTSLMIDAGKSCRETEKRMDALGKNISDVSAILITHKHSDHTIGAGIISRKFGIPVYMSPEVSSACMIGSHETKVFDTSIEFSVGSLRVKPVITSHNVSSCGFIINRKFGVITDTGCVTRQMEDAIKGLKSVLIESNHDIDMVIRGRYPAYLKQWILSNEGHLSNIDASLLLQNKAENLDTAILGHLSGNNNTPEKALEAFNTIVKKKIDVYVADRNRQTGNFTA